MTGSVKDMIRSVRSCKTPAEERAVIARECADIRSALSSSSSSERRKNIAKLLLIHLLGHSTNFGQVECIKLVASNKFIDKRMGYLALSLLLTEDTDVLTLAINSIKMDLNGTNPYAAEAALTALSNIGSREMFQELFYDLERLMKSPAVNVRKKAVVCAARMLRKLGQASLIPGPEALEVATNYVHVVPTLLGDPNHGVVTAALSILSVLIDYFPQCCNFPSIYELLVKTLHLLCNESTGGFGMMFGGGREYEVNGVNDPFLKVKLLALIRRVFAKSRDQVPGNQQLYDIVVQVVKTATISNNASNSLLYECVRTIYSEVHDPKFNQLGKDVVEKFISTNDNNVKYIALGILNNLVDVSLTVGDNYWTIIVQSLRQPDISIRRRALEVALKLLSRETLKPLMQHLYDFLIASSNDLKRESITKIAAALEQHAESDFQRLEIMVKIFSIAGNCVPDTILHSFIAAVGAATADTQIRITTKLYYLLSNNLGQDALVRAALWCFGEYAHMLPELEKVDVTPTSSVRPTTDAPAEVSQPVSDNLIDVFDSSPVTEPVKVASDPLAIGEECASTAANIASAVEAVGKHVLTCSATATESCTNGEYLLTCAAWLVCRLPSQSERMVRLIRKFKRHPNTELQQRACEMDVIRELGALPVLLGIGGGKMPDTLCTPAAGAATTASELLLPREAIQPRAANDDLLGLTELPSPKTQSKNQLETLDFLSFEYNTSSEKTTKANDEFGQFDPF
ncbi:adaptin N terminal region family protein, putative [Babesia bigemina]|uniref:AP-1 complex subunit gamma n=1 Tax=Babesia bigemina TaxID=5866 RepID=A0A061D8J6_BABBI|nr:adaptin N terminal region family protein, putative [Babesia bigemina]CDR95234.1 adaptin N terminal region family protein, putative [Babesia bigemina]|eukprot:XP_012767420.1 adaptin N terminal region family protein, putative [Babesia bigemina]